MTKGNSITVYDKNANALSLIKELSRREISDIENSIKPEAWGLKI